MGSYLSHVVKKLLNSILGLWFIVTFNFLLFRLLPGDPLRKLFRDPRIPQEMMDQVARSFGLDKPMWSQYVRYLNNLLHGNMGLSFSFRQPVWDVLGERLLNTLILMVPANIIAILLGVWLGIFAAKHRGKLEDAVGMGVGLLFWSMPTFWIGLIVIVYLSGGGLPSSGMTQPGMHYANGLAYLMDVLRHLVLPTLTLSLVLLGQYAIIMRNSLSSVMTEDYITTARAKGFNRDTIFRKYAVPNAMLPLVTIIAVNIGLSVAGAIQAEIVFHWPGLGSLVYDSVIKRDYPMLQGAFLVISAAVIFTNFLADLIYASLDPRIKINET